MKTRTYDQLKPNKSIKYIYIFILIYTQSWIIKKERREKQNISLHANKLKNTEIEYNKTIVTYHIDERERKNASYLFHTKWIDWNTR